MFMVDTKLPQSQSISGSSISGSQVSMAQAQGGSVNQAQQGNHSAGASGKQLTALDVVGLVGQIEDLVEGSRLPADVVERLRNRLSVIKDDVQEDEPDRAQAASSLKKVAEVLKASDEALSSGKGLWEKAQPIFGQLVGWFNVAKVFWGLS
jgi:hypothetical protein